MEAGDRWNMIDLTTRSWEQDMRNRLRRTKNRYYREIRRNRERVKVVSLYICTILAIVFAITRL